MVESFFAALIIVLVSLVGLVFGSVFARGFISKYLPYLVSLAAGVFFFTSLNLVREAFEITSASTVVGGAFAGFLFFLILERILPESHHHHGDTCQHGHNKKGATKMLLGDAFHNMADGLILVPAFLVSTTVGVITTVGILLHEMLQEVSEYFVLISSGYTHRQAIFRNAVVSLSIFAGLALSLVLSNSSSIQAIILSFSAGSFLYIVFHDLIPSSVFKKGGKKTLTHFFFFIVGIAILYFISTLLPHVH